MAFPESLVAEDMEVVVCASLGLVEASRVWNIDADNVRVRVIRGKGEGIPELEVEGQRPRHAQNTIADPDEARYPEENVKLPKEDGDVARVHEYWEVQREECRNLPKHGDEDKNRQQNVKNEEELVLLSSHPKDGGKEQGAHANCSLWFEVSICYWKPKRALLTNHPSIHHIWCQYDIQ